MTNLRIRQLEEKEFKAMDPVLWNRFVMGMSRPNVFYTYEWLSTWWKYFHSGYSFYFLAVYADNQMLGVVPLVKKFTTIEDGVLPVRVVLLAGSRELSPDHLDVIAQPGNGERVARLVIDHLMSCQREWDLLHLSHIDGDGILKQKLGDRISPGSQTDVMELSTAPYLTVDGDFDDYMHRTFRGKKRRQIEAWRRKLSTEGMEIRECAVGKEQIVMEELFRLHSLRAKEKGISSDFHHDHLKSFHTEIAPKLNANGFLKTLYIERAGEIHGVLYCFRCCSIISWYQIGVDPQYSKLSLGTLLVYELIKQAHEEGMSEVDFLRSPGAHKSRWTKTSRSLYGVNLYSPTIGGRLQRLAYRGRRRVVRVIKSFGYKAAFSRS